jgi:hypothetical protein
MQFLLQATLLFVPCSIHNLRQFYSFRDAFIAFDEYVLETVFGELVFTLDNMAAYRHCSCTETIPGW